MHHLVAAVQRSAVNAYPDFMTLPEARALFFARSNLGPNGGYEDRWVRVEAKPIPFYFPNSRARVAAARLHDLHHIAAEYETDWPGEIEISGWEIGSGCAHFYAAWILDLGGWVAGLALAPGRLLRAFVRGRRATTNLYRCGLRHDALDQMTVGELRSGLGLRRPADKPRPDDLVSFAGWSAAAVGLWVGVPAAGALLVLSLLRSRRH